MPARKLENHNLQAVLRLLRDGREYSTRDIIEAADVCAVNTVVSELRHHGAEIQCRRVVIGSRPRHLYRMTKEPPKP